VWVETRKRQFLVLWVTISTEALEIRPKLLCSKHVVPREVSTDRNIVTLNDLESLNGHFTLVSVFVRGFSHLRFPKKLRENK